MKLIRLDNVFSLPNILRELMSGINSIHNGTVNELQLHRMVQDPADG